MIRTVTTVVTLLFFSVMAYSQSHSKISVFNDDGNEFILTLNGELINETHESRVEVDELTQPQYSAVINFKNKSLGIVKKNLFLEPGNHYVYRVFTNRRGKQVLRLYSNTPLTDQVEEPSTKPVRKDMVKERKLDVETPPETVEEDRPVARDAEAPQKTKDSDSTEVTMTMPDGSKFEMTVKTGEGFADDERHKRESAMREQQVYEAEKTAEDSQVEPVEEPVIYVEGYTGRIGCPHPISQQEVSNIIKTIEGQTFSDSKMRTAKRALNNKCITVNDIGKIMNLFTFEDSKIEFAKHAFDYTHDVDNYYLLFNNFTFESSIEELENYIDK